MRLKLILAVTGFAAGVLAYPTGLATAQDVEPSTRKTDTADEAVALPAALTTENHARSINGKKDKDDVTFVDSR